MDMLDKDSEERLKTCMLITLEERMSREDMTEEGYKIIS